MIRRALLAFAALALGAQDPAWDYHARLSPSAGTLTVEARFAPGDADAFMVDDRCEPFVKDLEVASGGRWRPVPPAPEGGWIVSGAEAHGARLRWSFDLSGAAAHGGRRLSGVRGKGGTWLARSSSFLLRPVEYRPDREARLAMDTPDGLTFLSGIHRGEGPGTWVGRTDDFDDPPYSALGRWRVRSLQVAGATLDLAEPQDGTPIPAGQEEAWIRRSAGLLASAYGRFPLARAALILTPVEQSSGILFGTTAGHGGGGIIVLLGRTVSAADLDRDWVLTHEMIHLAMADLPAKHRWFEEGLPTYLEPLLRLRAGTLTPEAFWSDLRANLPKGEPREGDRGLDRTPTWGRTYWGGAMFCFLADLRIREKSGGRKTLLDALRAVVEAGDTAEERGRLREVLETADRALGFPVLVPLWESMAERPAPQDLEALWRRLGVTAPVLDDTAPEAALRKAWGR